MRQLARQPIPDARHVRAWLEIYISEWHSAYRTQTDAAAVVAEQLATQVAIAEALFERLRRHEGTSINVSQAGTDIKRPIERFARAMMEEDRRGIFDKLLAIEVLFASIVATT